ncbi:MAG: MBL fold metallo-hydrolase [Acidimicrobiia bacterium]|nr:MBL fold metallo-hydrolase [Acidimicrobiia bacterium]
MTATVEQIHLATVQLPDWHPRIDDGVAEVFGFAVRHPEGVILVDTGVGTGNDFIDDVYQPTVSPLVDALNGVGVDERDVQAIVNTHLHFDHCGQNDVLSRAPIWVTDAEVAVSTQDFYTVPEWAAITPSRRRTARDGEELAAGVRLLETPGHTPGHLSVAVDTADGLEVIVGQSCYCQAEFDGTAPPPVVDLHDRAMADVAHESLNRLRALHPVDAWFSHEASRPVA